MANSQPESFNTAPADLQNDLQNQHLEPDPPENLLGAAAVEEAPPVAVARRDENSISFRHFLQQQTDVVASRHHNSRSANAGVDLVDISIALPDFVQDHLVLEAESSQGSEAPLDLSVLHQMLPEYATSPRNQNSIGRRIAEESRNPFEASGAYAHSNTTSSQSQSTTLPDFLSDGPMYCTTTSTNENETSMNSNSNHSPFGASGVRSGGAEHRSEMNQRSHSVDTDTQAQQLDRLRREVMEKTRSITQLQNEVSRQRSEIYLLKEALAAAQGGQGTVHNIERTCRAQGRGENSSAESSPPRVNGGLAPDGNGLSSQVLHIVETSESLIRKLMLQLNALKDVAADSENTENQEKDN